MLYVQFGYDKPDGDEVVSADGPSYIIIGDAPANGLPEQWARAELWFLITEIEWLLGEFNRFLLDERCKKCIWSEVHEHIEIVVERRKHSMFEVRIETRTYRKVVVLPQDEVLKAFKRGFQEYAEGEYRAAGGENYEYKAEFKESLHKFLQLVS